MTKRKFSPKRLYKFLRFLVITGTLISAAMAIYQFRYYQYSQKAFLDAESEYQALPELPIPPPSGFGDKELNGNYLKKMRLLDKKNLLATAMVSAREKSVVLAAIAILLPVIFFGGIGIYRYLFPKKEG